MNNEEFKNKFVHALKDKLSMEVVATDRNGDLLAKVSH